MRGNDKQSTSGEQVAPKTPAGSTSPVHQERIASQENTTEDLYLTCRLDPDHPGVWRCTSVPGPVLPNADSSVSMPSVDTPASKSGEGGTGIPTSDGIEVWSRNNGETMHVKRVEHEGNVIYMPLAAAPQPQTVDHQDPTVKAVNQDPTVGRTQISPCGSGNKRSCPLPSSRRLARAKQDDQAAKGP